jgi:hypothetical protein
MKIAFVTSENDYGALNFEEWGGVEKLKSLKKKKDFSHSVKGEELFSVQFMEFGSVDPKFVEFIKDQIMDYDESKDVNFYIIEE